MGKYSFNEDTTVHKLDLAKVQLEAAIDMFLSAKYLPAFTLASAADGILEGHIRSTKFKTTAVKTWEGAVAFKRQHKLSDTSYNKENVKDAINEWNSMRNIIKHHDNNVEETLKINFFDVAYIMIQRANADGDILMMHADNRQEYENWLVQNIYT
ncbi:hypothetical protein [Mesorhizobium sp. B2-3-5]|uniref:hypothetical protein n=1 Tax=Mesorhizobium sp. B2-3-5 TaxID=2589958 RepID=UPI00112A744D|nr:hypothetical protein [Mesorhizobium sp. B2-3-5]TPM27057.1 hypothetical protein FJ958_17965 [Mesorhizobium sp. B2-3-5]